MTKLYENIELLRKERDITLQGLQDATGVPKSTVSDWKKEGSSPKTDNVESIANYFDVSVDFLLGRTENRYSHKKELSHGTVCLIEAIETSNLNDRDVSIVLKIIKAFKEE